MGAIYIQPKYDLTRACSLLCNYSLFVPRFWILFSLSISFMLLVCSKVLLYHSILFMHFVFSLFFYYFVYYFEQLWYYSYWIRCTYWFDAGSRIFENILRLCFFLILAPEGGSNLAGPYPNPFPNPGGQN